jgi:thiaminase/transcriptional activator TenA
VTARTDDDVFERLKAAAAADWKSYVDHAFVREMGAGTLPQAAFRTYLVQDYLFLIQFARAYALATYKSRTLADMKAAQTRLAGILNEMDLHVRLCGRWGLSPADIEAAPSIRRRWPIRVSCWIAARRAIFSTCMSRLRLALLAIPRSAAT